MSDSPAYSPTLTRGLARLIRSHPVKPEDLRQAERYVRDWLGCYVAGHATAAGAVLREYGSDAVDVESAVFLASALSHITETDDLHRASVTHPGCVVVPTSLLLGRSLSADGSAILRSVLAGFEAMLRVGEALGPAHYRIFHNTATAGVFGAAAAAASLLDLTEDQWVWAFGNAGTQAAGLWQFNEDATMSKHLHAGHAAAAGLRAARLAGRGFSGPGAILEGSRGFFRALCPDAVPDAVLAPRPGWKLPETSMKPYPCCRHTHPAIDPALVLRQRLQDEGLPLEELSVRISTYPAARAVIDNPDPHVPYAAKFSMQFCVATALVQGVPTLESFQPERLNGPEVRSIMARSTVVVTPELEAAYPDAWGAVVRLEWPDGRFMEEACDSARGDPECPLEDAELDEKVRSLCRFGGLTEEQASALLGECARLATGGDAFLLPVPPKSSSPAAG